MIVRVKNPRRDEKKILFPNDPPWSHEDPIVHMSLISLDFDSKTAQLVWPPNSGPFAGQTEHVPWDDVLNLPIPPRTYDPWQEVEGILSRDEITTELIRLRIRRERLAEEQKKKPKKDPSTSTSKPKKPKNLSDMSDKAFFKSLLDVDFATMKKMLDQRENSQKP
jgi:hypothetical protein